MRSASATLSDASPLSMFFQSLLPNFNVQQGGFPAVDAQAANVANQNIVAAAAAADPEAAIAQLQLNDDAEGLLNKFVFSSRCTAPRTMNC